MPPNLKALATVAAWVLFVAGCGGVLLGLFMFASQKPGSVQTYAVASMSLILSVVSIWLRGKMG